MTDAERFLADDPPFATPEEFAKVMKEMDGEMRLIDADALAKEMENAKYVSNTSAYAKGCNDAINYCIRRLKELPAIDPVRHGRWMIGKDGVPRCTGCGYRFELFGLPAVSTHCPACGAKMDGAT